MGLLGRTRRGCGYLPDLLDHRDFDFDRLGLASSRLPAEVSLRPEGLRPFNQGSTNTCVAQAVAQAIRIRAAHQSGALPEPLSRLAIYWNARAYHGATRQDLGTHIRFAIRGLQVYGAPPEHVWPFETGLLGGRVNKKPSLASYQLGHDFGGVRGYYRIRDAGERKLLAIKAAIAAGYPVVAGWMVDRDFLDDAGPVLVDAQRGPIVGGHAMLLDGYSGETGAIVNSWPSWRAGGFATFTADMLLEAIDVWAIDV